MENLPASKRCSVTQSCPVLCGPRTAACQAPLSVEILQARVLEWVAMPSSRGSSRPRDGTRVSRIGSRRFNLKSRTSLKSGTEKKERAKEANSVNINGTDSLVLESDIDKISDANTEGFVYVYLLLLLCYIIIICSTMQHAGS